MPCLRLSTALAIDPTSDYQQRIWIALPLSSFIRRRHLFHIPTETTNIIWYDFPGQEKYGLHPFNDSDKIDLVIYV